MNERLQCISFTMCNPNDAAALGDLEFYLTVPCAMTIVAVSAAPDTDDADTTLDIHDDGTAIISAMACADKENPGQWNAAGYGGTNTPVVVAAGSELSFDVNGAANGTVLHVQIWYLLGETWA